MESTVWFRFTPSTDLRLDASTFGSNYDTILEIYAGHSQSSMTLVGCNDNAGGTVQSQVVFTAAAGVTYHFQVAGSARAVGTLQFNLAESFSPAPQSNDNFAEAMEITSLPFTDARDTSLATVEPGEPTCFQATATVWYRFSSTIPIRVTFDTGRSNYDTVLAVYLDTGIGTGFERLEGYECRDNWHGHHSELIDFNAVPLVTYYVQVGASFQDPDAGFMEFNAR